MTQRWWLSLGGNLGDVATTLVAAEARLDSQVKMEVVNSSRRFRTAPVGANAGKPFLNACVEIETTLEPLQLLECVQFIETRLGRVRTEHWGPRTIDIDLLFAAPVVEITSPRLTVPHPHLWYRRFVLEPLCDIAADVVIAPYGRTVQEIAALWCSQWRVGVFSSTGSAVRDAIVRAVAERFPARCIEAWTPGQPRPELLAVIGEATGIKPPFLSLPDDVPAATQALMDAITAAEDTPVPVG